MLLRVLVILLGIFIIYKIFSMIRRQRLGASRKSQIKSNSVKGEDLVEDPVCHTYVPVSQAYRKEIDGKDYFFCSGECCEKFMLEKK
jgi:uncharacterized protein